MFYTHMPHPTAYMFWTLCIMEIWGLGLDPYPNPNHFAIVAINAIW